MRARGLNCPVHLWIRRAKKKHHVSPLPSSQSCCGRCCRHPSPLCVVLQGDAPTMPCLWLSMSLFSFLSSGSCWEPVMCTMFCKAQGLQTSLQSAGERQGQRNHRAQQPLIMSESSMSYKGLTGIVYSFMETASHKTARLSHQCVVRIQWTTLWPGYR